MKNKASQLSKYTLFGAWISAFYLANPSLVLSNTVCNVEQLPINGNDRAELVKNGPYKRMTYYYSTESHKDLTWESLWLHYLSYSLNQTVTPEQLKTWNSLMKKAEKEPRECDVCQLNDADFRMVMNKNWAKFYQSAPSKELLVEVSDKVNDFQLGIPFLEQPNRPYYYFSYSIFNWVCTHEDGLVETIRFKSEDFSRVSMNKIYFDKYYTSLDQELEENELRLEKMFEKHGGYMNYLVKSTATIPRETQIVRAINYTSKLEKERLEEIERNKDKVVVAPTPTTEPIISPEEKPVEEAPVTRVNVPAPEVLPVPAMKPVTSTAPAAPAPQTSEIKIIKAAPSTSIEEETEEQVPPTVQTSEQSTENKIEETKEEKEKSGPLEKLKNLEIDFSPVKEVAKKSWKKVKAFFSDN